MPMMMIRSGPPRFKREAMVLIGLFVVCCRHYHDAVGGKQRTLWESKGAVFIRSAGGMFPDARFRNASAVSIGRETALHLTSSRACNPIAG